MSCLSPCHHSMWCCRYHVLAWCWLLQPSHVSTAQDFSESWRTFDLYHPFPQNTLHSTFSSMALSMKWDIGAQTYHYCLRGGQPRGDTWLLYVMSKRTWTCMLVHCWGITWATRHPQALGRTARGLHSAVLLSTLHSHSAIGKGSCQWMYAPCMPHRRKNEPV